MSTPLISSPLLNAAIRKPPTQIHTSTLDGPFVPTNDTSTTNSADGDSQSLPPPHHHGADFEDEIGASSLGDDSDEESQSGAESRGMSNLVNKKETELVNCSKMCVVLVVSLLAAIVGLSVYVYVSRDEQYNYDTSVSIEVVVVDE